jgi:outer membrane lipoprotein-sorting protein
MTTTIAAAALMLAMTASMFDTAHTAAFGELIALDSVERLTAIDVDDYDHGTDTQVNSLKVTQSTEDGLEVECEGNLKCEIIGDGTVVATSEDNNTTIVSKTSATTTTTTTSLNQSNIAEFSNDFDGTEEQDLGAMIEGMVDRLLDKTFA